MFAALFHHADTERCLYQALDRFSCNSIGRTERPGVAKNGRGKRTECHGPEGETSGGNMSRGEMSYTLGNKKV